MSALLALDVALLLPPDARQRAVQLSARLRHDAQPDSSSLVLDEEHHAHVTLTQQFVRTDELEHVYEHIDTALRGQRPLTLRVTGVGNRGSTVWLAIEPSAELVSLHERLMASLLGLERPGGTASAFFDGDARIGDVAWVTAYRLKSSVGAYTPHVTLGHTTEPPMVEPFSLDAAVVAACHLGRYCACRQVLRSWELKS